MSALLERQLVDRQDTAGETDELKEVQPEERPRSCRSIKYCEDVTLRCCLRFASRVRMEL